MYSIQSRATSPMLRPVRFVSVSTRSVDHTDRGTPRGANRRDQAPDRRGEPQRDRQLDGVDHQPEAIGAGIFVVKPRVVVQVPRTDHERIGPDDGPSAKQDRDESQADRQDQDGSRPP